MSMTQQDEVALSEAFCRGANLVMIVAPLVQNQGKPMHKQRDIDEHDMDEFYGEITPEEMAEMDSAYKVWEAELEAAIKSGDPARIQQALEDGK